MAVLKRRTRIVSFRISEDEYQDLIGLCVTREARSLSEFARLATLGQTQAMESNGHAQGILTDVYRQLRLLDAEVKKLAALVAPDRRDSMRSVQSAEAAQA
jgi:hypothetical protein